MSTQKFRKKPVVIEAVKFRGSTTQVGALKKWIREGTYTEPTVVTSDITSFVIDTLEGLMRVKAGDWVIRGVQGEFYPCKPDIFTATYEPTEEDQ